MDYIEKTQRVRLAGLSELLVQPDGASLNKEPTESNVADLFTKALNRESFVKHRLNLQARDQTHLRTAHAIKLSTLRGERLQAMGA